MNKVALVTGGAGFIGSNLVKLLLNNGWTVKIVDNLSTGYKKNLDQLNVELIIADITNAQILREICNNVDVVFHLAACVGRQKSLDNPVQDSNTNVIGTINILEAMRINKVKRIVYSSSAAIFGELETDFIDEDHPQNADSPYGVSKLAAEKMILAYSDIYNIDAVCLRYFNIYGINQRFDLYGNVVPIFAKRLYSNEPITIFGDGSQSRDFVNVKDVARANLLSAESGIKKGVYNLGSGESITINDLACMMKEITDIKASIEYAPERPADVKHCKANTKKVMNELGFSTQISLKDGLVEYLEWFEKDKI